MVKLCCMPDNLFCTLLDSLHYLTMVKGHKEPPNRIRLSVFVLYVRGALMKMHDMDAQTKSIIVE